MKAVMKSVSPRICEKVANGNCTILVSKTAPKCDAPFKEYIYATKAKKWFHSGIILTSDELLWLSNGKIKMCDGFELWADGEDYQCVNSKVIGEFVCDEVEELHEWELSPQGKFADFERERLKNFLTAARLSEEEVVRYRGNLPCFKPLYGLHISDLKIYDKPKELVEFYKCGAESFEKLFDVDGLCQYCSETDYGEHKYDISSRWGMVSCEGRWCDEAYQQYLDENFALTRAPSNWCYVEEL